MEEITKQETNKIIEQGKEELQQITNEGGKITKTIIEEKDKITTIFKVEPVNGKATSSKMITTKNDITIKCL